jgi:hypothetical protein
MNLCEKNRRGRERKQGQPAGRYMVSYRTHYRLAANKGKEPLWCP